ncbi:hypothetical protein [Candidatus Kuenenia stuttgartiensis]|uniref:hypothetical protein n=1 Tax=Kuenenia stuttgartiensis TaxID=174633 RepID=UPI00146DD6FC|nr:hypothetical protein [Candidatus Kuenenia stuttgartiensis]
MKCIMPVNLWKIDLLYDDPIPTTPCDNSSLANGPLDSSSPSIHIPDATVYDAIGTVPFDSF